MNKPKAISVLSGGLDSAVATSMLIDKYDISTITFDYGQKSADIEIKSAKNISKFFNIPNKVIDLKWLGKLGNSALTSDFDVMDVDVDKLDDKEYCDETVKNVWVPSRNIVFTAVASAFAEANGAKAIIVGWDLEEALSFPDNSIEFLNAFNKVLDIGTLDKVQVIAPLIKMSKEDIVLAGVKAKTPFELSYSCYKGDIKPCGVCESCLRRSRAFKSLGIEDPEFKL